MEDLDRLRQAITYLKHRGQIHIQQDIADRLKMDKGRISKALKGEPGKLTHDFLRRFAAAYADYLNEDWLVEGKGQMAKPDKNLRPHIEAKAAAGFMDGISEGEGPKILHHKIRHLPEYDFTIEVSGDSMTPDFQDGDIVACRIEDDRQNPPIGKICVIDSKDGAALKEIIDKTDSAIICHSLNPKYPDYEIDFSDINRIARVVGDVRIID